jgi:diketogulonate reductase-like aldo/keto reductase
MHRAFDRGITHFDLANNYGPPAGSAEENVGRILTGLGDGEFVDPHVSPRRNRSRLPTHRRRSS